MPKAKQVHWIGAGGHWAYGDVFEDSRDDYVSIGIREGTGKHSHRGLHVHRKDQVYTKPCGKRAYPTKGDATLRERLGELTKGT